MTISGLPAGVTATNYVLTLNRLVSGVTTFTVTHTNPSGASVAQVLKITT